MQIRGIISMKKIVTFMSACLICLTLAACGSNSKQAKDNSSLKAENSSLKAKKRAENSSLKAKQSETAQTSSDQATSSSSSNQDSSNRVINSPQEAINLVAHSFHTAPDTLSATETSDGYIVSSSVIQPEVVHYDGSVTYSDGTNQSYSSVSAPTADD